MKTLPPKRLKSESPLILSCLGGNPPENALLDDQRYVISLIENPLGKIYPYLNFSEVLSVIDEYSQFKIFLHTKNIYEALKKINKDFFPKLNRRIHYLSESQELKLKKLDIYKKKKSLEKRIDTIPDELQKEIIYGMVHPICPIIETKVPLFKKRNRGKIYAKIRSEEISRIINTFSREYFPEFC